MEAHAYDPKSGAGPCPIDSASLSRCSDSSLSCCSYPPSRRQARALPASARTPASTTPASWGRAPASGFHACSGNSGESASAACQDERACLDNHGRAGESACRGEFACSDNEGTVGKNACVGVFAACKSRSRSSWRGRLPGLLLRAPGPSRTPPRSARTPVSAGMLVLTIQARWEHRPVAASSRAPGTPGRSARSPAGAITSARIAWARSATTPVSARKHAHSRRGRSARAPARATGPVQQPRPHREGDVERDRPWVACVCEIPICTLTPSGSLSGWRQHRCRSVFKTERSPHTSHLPGFRASVIGRMPAPWLGAMPTPLRSQPWR